MSCCDDVVELEVKQRDLVAKWGTEKIMRQAAEQRIAALEKQLKDARDFAEHLRTQALKEADKAAALEKQREVLRKALGHAVAFIEDDTCRHDDEKATPLAHARAALKETAGP